MGLIHGDVCEVAGCRDVGSMRCCGQAIREGRKAVVCSGGRTLREEEEHNICMQTSNQ